MYNYVNFEELQRLKWKLTFHFDSNLMGVNIFPHPSVAQMLCSYLQNKIKKSHVNTWLLYTAIPLPSILLNAMNFPVVDSTPAIYLFIYFSQESE